MSKAYFPTTASSRDYAAKPPIISWHGWKAVGYQRGRSDDGVTYQERSQLYTVRAKSFDVEAVIKVILLDGCVTVNALGYAVLGSFVSVYEHLCRHRVRVQR